MNYCRRESVAPRQPSACRIIWRANTNCARRVSSAGEGSRCHREWHSGQKCCAPHYSSGLIPVEIIYVQLALLPRITPRFALAVPTPLKFMSVTKTVRPYLPPWVKDGQILSVLLTMRHAYLTHRAVLPHVSCPTRFYTTISLRIRLVWLQKLKKCHPIYSKFTPQYKI